MNRLHLAPLALLLPYIAVGADWPQGPGPNFNFVTAASHAPTSWSVAKNQNVAWKTDLPETGQSAPVIWGERLFVTTMKPIDADAETGSDIVVYALSTKDGSVAWQRDIPGGYQTKLSAPFGDASAPAPVTDGKRLWVLNPTGRLVCFDLDGNEIWTRPVTSVSRTQPVLFDGKLILHRQVYLPDDHGHFTHENARAPHDRWTQLQAIDADSGDLVWRSECGANMGCIPLVQRLDDGRPVLVVGRGGGHGPPETPEGVSMIGADNGQTVWTLELPGFMSTQTYPIADGQALVFHKGDHLWVDTGTGKISRQVSIVRDISTRRWAESGYNTLLESLAEKKPRSITQQSNLLVGDYHYFRAYTRNYLGRIHIQSGVVEYLELPLQVLREPGKPDKVLWNADHITSELISLAGQKKKKRDLTNTSLRLNDVRNSRGFRVMGDARAQANGWGHTASPVPTAFGNKLIVPLLSGMVFVIQADASELDENSVLAINDLGPLGKSFTRASLTTDGKRVFAHTIQGVLAFQ
jgi:outer membrane protein assembly factor BamB